MANMQSQIAERIREMSEPNRRIEEEKRAADEEMSKGIVSDPKVEQVKPKPGNNRKKSAVVTAKEGPFDEVSFKSTGKSNETERESMSLQEEKHFPEKTTSEENAETRPEKNSLNRSMDDFETLLSLAGPAASKEKDTKAIKKPAPEEPMQEPVRPARTTVKENPRHKGPHAVHKRVIKLQSEIAAKAEEQDQLTAHSFCLYEPLTGSLNELRRDITIIGKSREANIIINNRYISDIHARITREPDGFYIEDIGTRGKGSTNGTKINGERIRPGVAGRTKLIPGDNITLAATQLIFQKCMT